MNKNEIVRYFKTCPKIVLQSIATELDAELKARNPDDLEARTQNLKDSGIWDQLREKWLAATSAFKNKPKKYSRKINVEVEFSAMVNLNIFNVNISDFNICISAKATGELSEFEEGYLDSSLNDGLNSIYADPKLIPDLDFICEYDTVMQEIEDELSKYRIDIDQFMREMRNEFEPNDEKGIVGITEEDQSAT